MATARPLRHLPSVPSAVACKTPRQNAPCPPREPGKLARMLSTTGKQIIAYGAFLILAGLTGFLSNPEKAKTALMSGGLFGGLSMLWGWLTLQGKRWAAQTALVMTGLLTLVFGWRIFIGWRQVAAGNSDKLFAALLISSMLAASLVLLPLIWRGLRRIA